jgi:uncharacterized protein YjeT (DUF2065 family)
MLQELGVAIGLLLVLEGILYAVAPDAMRRMLQLVLSQPEQTIRMTGIGTAIVGLLVVLLVRG